MRLRFGIDYLPKESMINRVKTTGRQLFYCILISLFLLHFPLFISLYYFDKFANPSFVPPSRKSTEVVFVTPPEPEIPLSTLPLVDMAKPAVENAPTTPSARGLYDISTPQEMVAPTASPAVIKASPSPNSTKQAGKSSDKPASSAPSHSATEKKPPSPQAPKPEPPILATPQNQKPSFSSLAQSLVAEHQQNEEKNYTQKFGQAPLPIPQNEDEEPIYQGKSFKSFGGDFLPNFSIGPVTLLNTVADPHAPYFIELKHKFRIAFNPRKALSKINFQQDNIRTTLKITLNDKGRLLNVIVIQSSGSIIYDEECIRTVRVSAPFTDPPPHLRNDKNLFETAWSFIVYH